MTTNHSDEVNVEILFTHFLLDVHKGGLGSRLGVDLESLFTVNQI